MSEMIKDHPPFFRSWRRVYALILIVLLTEIALMYWITRQFA